MFIVVCKVGGNDFGVLVDRVFDTEEIVVKPVSEMLKSIPLYSGNTILGDGSVIMILDPNGLARTLGTMELVDRDHVEAAAQAARRSAEPLISFLLFGLGKGAPKAVPLELISRLEEIDVATIEVADGRPVVQYRGDLMCLITLGDTFIIPSSGMMNVIVFSYDKKIIGLAVSEIIDIVHAPFAIKMASKDGKKHGYLGSMVIAGRTTDVVDVGYLLSEIVEQLVTDQVMVHKPKDCNLLLVEDSPFFRNLTVPFLSAVGYRVTAADTAEEALRMLGSDDAKFDMIVTDIEMPGMNGFEFASACRSNPSINGIPIVAYTASISDEVLRRSKAAGMNDIIVKTDRPGLLQSVSHWLTEGVHV